MLAFNEFHNALVTLHAGTDCLALEWWALLSEIVVVTMKSPTDAPL